MREIYTKIKREDEEEPWKDESCVALLIERKHFTERIIFSLCFISASATLID